MTADRIADIRDRAEAATPVVDVTRYEVSLLPAEDINRHGFTITVEYRGRGLWAVRRHSHCLGADGTWSYESIPSERRDEWLAAHRFPLDDALRLAKEQAPHIRVNGTTAVQALTDSLVAADRAARREQHAALRARRNDKTEAS